MATPNYGFPTIDASAKINIATDVNSALDSIDTALKTVSDEKAPVNHANAESTYGQASSSLFGHTKLTDTVDASNAASGTAATAAAIKSYAMPLLTFRNSVVIIGDSYAASNSPAAHIQSKLESNFPEFDFYNYGDTGSGYTMKGSAGYNFSEQIDNAAANIQSDHSVSPADVGYVMIFGGRNDCGAQTSLTLPNYSTYYPKVLQTYQNAKAKFPNAKVAAFFLYDWKLPNTGIFGMQDIMQEAGANEGIFVAENSWSLGTGKMASMYVGGTDIHPNENGAEIMAVQCMNALLDNKRNMMVRQYFYYWSSQTNNNIYMEMHEKGISVNIFGKYTGENDNVICPKDKCPTFLRGADNTKTDWYKNGDTFSGASRPILIPATPTDGTATVSGLVQFSHLGINLTGFTANKKFQAFTTIPLTFNDQFDLRG